MNFILSTLDAPKTEETSFYERRVRFFYVTVQNHSIFSAPKYYLIITDYTKEEIKEAIKKKEKKLIDISAIPTNSLNLPLDREVITVFKPNY